MPSKLSQLADRMDSLYEFDREPVSPDKLQGGTKFAGLFAGEHVAATEFVIGAFFVLHGAAAWDIVWGLLLGNILAVATWTLVCAPIAVRTRLTLYWHLRQVGGPGMMIIYNVVNGALFCGIAGAMVSVAATAVGLGLGIPSPELNAVYPNSVGWVMLTFAIGALMTVLAILGFEKLSQFAEICSPWMFVVFLAGAVSMLSRLGVESDLSNLWQIAQEKIWTGVPTAGQEKFTFWHILFFAWVCNASFHFGLTDMATLRYAKNWKYGLYSAFGMFPGHMLAWMCSGVMVAAVAREMNPGLMAYEAAGIAGAFAVLVAGWTTANPTLYRAGLAFQAVTANTARWKVTLIAGLITTAISCFPFIFMRLLDYVAVFGLIMTPVGSIVFAEHWLLTRMGVERAESWLGSRGFNRAALLAWGLTVAVSLAAPVHLFFKPVIAWLTGLALYVALRRAGIK